jgi:hypothetical protein
MQFCKKPIYRLFKVKVFHPNSGRKSWQTWRFCYDHFNKFVKTNGEGWFCHYRKEDLEAPVIEFNLEYC